MRDYCKSSQTAIQPENEPSYNVFVLFFRFSFTLEKSRELEIDIYWRDWRSLCAVKFLRLEEFVDDHRHGMALELEPQGLLFAEVSVKYGLFLNGCSRET